MEQTVNAPADISADYSFIMDDDSMSGDGIRAGDIVYFAACDHVDNGQIAAVQTPDSVEICHVWQHRRYIALVPADVKRSGTIVQDADRDSVKIIGRAIAVLHMLNTETENKTMKRTELRALGMTPEQIDAVMQMNGNDVNRLKADTMTKNSREAQRLRESCVVLLELLDSPEAIRAVLLHVSRLYTEQERSKPQEGAR